MLKGIEKNLTDNYIQMINHKRKDQIKSKDDVSVIEAFELYMLKNFHNIKLNSLTSRMLNFWEKDFDKSIFEHIEFLTFFNQRKMKKKRMKIQRIIKKISQVKMIIVRMKTKKILISKMKQKPVSIQIIILMSIN